MQEALGKPGMEFATHFSLTPEQGVAPRLPSYTVSVSSGFSEPSVYT